MSGISVTPGPDLLVCLHASQLDNNNDKNNDSDIVACLTNETVTSKESLISVEGGDKVGELVGWLLNHFEKNLKKRLPIKVVKEIEAMMKKKPKKVLVEPGPTGPLFVKKKNSIVLQWPSIQ